MQPSFSPLAIRNIVMAIVFLIASDSSAQRAEADSVHACDAPCSRCLRWTAVGAITAATTAYIGLDQAWYAQYDRSAFHFFNDADEWLQMDKTGHFLSCYAVGSWGHAMMKHCGASDRSARWLGGSVGLLYMTGIEVLDGTSAGWGFSWSDMATNAAGSALFIGQDAAWGEQRIVPKISARLTPYAAQRPDLLGEGFADRLLKDYNGITLWMSFNLASLSQSDALPPWLNVAVGYGAEGMISAHPLQQTDGDPVFRQFYFAPDIDLTRIRSRSKVVRTLLFLANSIKVPLPGVEYRTDGTWKGHWLCF